MRVISVEIIFAFDDHEIFADFWRGFSGPRGAKCSISKHTDT